MSLTPMVQRNIAAVLREMIHDEVLHAYPKKGPAERLTVEGKVERALRLYLYRLHTIPLTEANPKAFIKGFLARRK